MSVSKKICKICGKEYVVCPSLYRKGTYRWQDVACSPEHGSEYLAEILASRSNDTSVFDSTHTEGSAESTASVVPQKKTKKKKPDTQA